MQYKKKRQLKQATQKTKHTKIELMAKVNHKLYNSRKLTH